MAFFAQVLNDVGELYQNFLERAIGPACHAELAQVLDYDSQICLYPLLFRPTYSLIFGLVIVIALFYYHNPPSKLPLWLRLLLPFTFYLNFLTEAYSIACLALTCYLVLGWFSSPTATRLNLFLIFVALSLFTSIYFMVALFYSSGCCGVEEVLLQASIQARMRQYDPLMTCFSHYFEGYRSRCGTILPVITAARNTTVELLHFLSPVVSILGASLMAVFSLPFMQPWLNKLFCCWRDQPQLTVVERHLYEFFHSNFEPFQRGDSEPLPSERALYNSFSLQRERLQQLDPTFQVFYQRITSMLTTQRRQRGLLLSDGMNFWDDIDVEIISNLYHVRILLLDNDRSRIFGDIARNEFGEEPTKIILFRRFDARINQFVIQEAVPRNRFEAPPRDLPSENVTIPYGLAIPSINQ